MIELKINALDDKDVVECLKELQKEGMKVQFGKAGAGRITTALKDNSVEWTSECDLIVRFRKRTEEEQQEYLRNLGS